LAAVKRLLDCLVGALLAVPAYTVGLAVILRDLWRRR
jgi:hypothetical protein